MTDLEKLKDIKRWISFFIWCEEEGEKLKGNEMYISLVIGILRELKTV